LWRDAAQARFLLGRMESMSLRTVLFLFCAALGLGCAVSAQAQAGVYGTVDGYRFNGVTCLDPQHQCASNDGTVRSFGGTFGALYDFKSYGPVRLGVDLRGGVQNSNKSASNYIGSTDVDRHYFFLGGVRGSVATPIKILRPYAQISAGFARTNDELTTNYQNYTQVQGFVGLDVSLLPMLDLRAIEFGAGEVFGPSSHSIQSIGAGLVFHLAR
jgi:hypothetical protein